MKIGDLFRAGWGLNTPKEKILIVLRELLEAAAKDPLTQSEIPVLQEMIQEYELEVARENAAILKKQENISLLKKYGRKE